MRKLGNRFLHKHWLTPNTYDSNFGPLPHGPGVYLLVQNSIKQDGKIKRKILYAGMSTNLHNRFKQHEVLNLLQATFNWVMIYFRPYPAKRIRMLEKHLIRTFNPPYNIIGKVRGK